MVTSNFIRIFDTSWRNIVQDDQIIETYIPPPHPRGIELSGQWVRLEPLDISRHSKDLFQANTMDRDGSNWAYLPYGPFATLEAYETWLSEAALTPDPNFLRSLNVPTTRRRGWQAICALTLKMDQLKLGISTILRCCKKHAKARRRCIS